MAYLDDDIKLSQERLLYTTHGNVVGNRVVQQATISSQLGVGRGGRAMVVTGTESGKKMFYEGKLAEEMYKYLSFKVSCTHL